MIPLVRYLIWLELGFLAFGLVLGVIFYFAYGPLPAIRMLFGCIAAANLGLLWVFRKPLFEYIRGRRS
jgi:hypothetical protein